MNTLRMLGLVTACWAGSTLVQATIFDLVFERLDFTSPEAVRAKATVGGPADRPLDMTAEGLGCDAVGTDNAYVDAWVRTGPIPLGSYGQPWDQVGFTVEIQGFVDESGFSCVSRVFVRHSPDRKNWTAWQTLFRKTPAILKTEADQFERDWAKASDRAIDDRVSEVGTTEAYKKRTVFTCDLGVPRRTREAYEKLLAEFAATNPPRPKFQEDAVRWILERKPHYLEKDPPFIGYVEFLIEVGVGQSPRRLKSVTIYGSTLVDGLMGHLTDKNRAEFEDKKWSFVAP